MIIAIGTLRKPKIESIKEAIQKMLDKADDENQERIEELSDKLEYLENVKLYCNECYRKHIKYEHKAKIKAKEMVNNMSDEDMKRKLITYYTNKIKKTNDA